MANWQTKRLGELAKVQTGPFGAQLHEKDYVKSSGTPIITVENLVGSVVKLLPNTPRVSDEDKKRLRRYVLNQGDIVFSRVGAVDRSAYVTNEANGWMFSGRLLRVHPGRELDAKYLNYHFNDEHTRNIVRNLAVGGTMPSLNTAILNFVPIKYPDKPEQERIVRILETWDEYIEKLERKISLKEQLKIALMQQIFSRKHRFKQFGRNWREVRLEEVATIKRGKPLTSSQLIPGEYPVIAGGKKSPYKHAEYTHEDVITVSASGANAGYVAYQARKIWASDSSVIFGRTADYHTLYIYYWLYFIQDRIYGLQTGGAQPHVQPSDLKRIRIHIPEISEQLEIIQLLGSVDIELDLLERVKADVAKQKKYLLKNLIAGTIRTPETLTPKGVN